MHQYISCTWIIPDIGLVTWIHHESHFPITLRTPLKSRLKSFFTNLRSIYFAKAFTNVFISCNKVQPVKQPITLLRHLVAGISVSYSFSEISYHMYSVFLLLLKSFKTFYTYLFTLAFSHYFLFLVKHSKMTRSILGPQLPNRHRGHLNGVAGKSKRTHCIVQTPGMGWLASMWYVVFLVIYNKWHILFNQESIV